MKLAAIYTRYSSVLQDKASTIRQLEDCRRYAAEHGMTVVAEYSDEALSGRKVHKRERFLQLVDDARAHKFEAVIFWDMDRFFRNIEETYAHLALFRKAGVEVHDSTKQIEQVTETGKIQTAIAALLADIEASKIGKRTLAGRKSAAEKGWYVAGQIGYGYRKVQTPDPATGRMRWTVEIDEEEAAVVRFIFEEYCRGSGVRKIAGELQRRSVYTPTGDKIWNQASVSAILRREAYTGRYVFGNTSGKAHAETQIPAIIDADTWQRAEKRKEESKTNRRGTSSPRPLTGIAFCALCGKSYVITGSPLRIGFPLACWGRIRRKECENRRYVAESKVIAAVKDRLRQILHPKAVKASLARIIASSDTQRALARQRCEDLKRQIEDNAKRAGRMFAAYEDDLMPRDAVTARLVELEAAKKTLLTDLKAAEARATMPKITGESVKQLAELVYAKIDELEGPELRRVLLELKVRAEINDKAEITVSCGAFEPATVTD